MIVLVLTLTNIVFLFLKTRPKLPEVVFEHSATWMAVAGSSPEVDSVHLDKRGRWQNRAGKQIKLAQITSLTIPNFDTLSYWVFVEQQERWLIADVVKAIRAAAAEGVCNLIIVDREMGIKANSDDMPPELPILSVAEYSAQAGGPLQPCVSDPAIARRYEKAEREHRRLSE